MDLMDLAQQIGEMRGEFRTAQRETADALGRIEGRLDEIPTLCYDHRSRCATEREAAEGALARRVSDVEDAARPTTVRQVWSWAQYLATVSAGAALSGFAVYEGMRRLQLIP